MQLFQIKINYMLLGKPKAITYNISDKENWDWEIWVMQRIYHVSTISTDIVYFLSRIPHSETAQGWFTRSQSCWCSSRNHQNPKSIPGLPGPEKSWRLERNAKSQRSTNSHGGSENSISVSGLPNQKDSKGSLISRHNFMIGFTLIHKVSFVMQLNFKITIPNSKQNGLTQV